MIYFVRCASGQVKIGYTQFNAIKRLSALQSSHPEKLMLLGCIEGERLDEQALHKKFASSRLLGEWFTYTADIAEYLAQARKIAPVVPSTFKTPTEPEQKTAGTPSIARTRAQRILMPRPVLIRDRTSQLMRQLTKESLYTLQQTPFIYC